MCGFALIFGLPRLGRDRTFEMGIVVFVLSIIVAVIIAGWQNSAFKTYDEKPLHAASTCSAFAV